MQCYQEQKNLAEADLLIDAELAGKSHCMTSQDDFGKLVNMQLRTLLAEIAVVERDITITGLTLDSREVQVGYAFVAVAGSKQHGLLHAVQAIKKGASTIIYEKGYDKAILNGIHDVVLIEIENLRCYVGEIAARFYQHPSSRLPVIAITGTNGKTSCSQFLAQIIPGCGVIGTLGWGEPGKLQRTINTTPDAISIQGMLAAFSKQQNACVVMEVSSHGLEQGRVNGICFNGAVFTNISRDHLDYHGSMDSYIQAKLSLLENRGLQFVVLNLDDEYQEQIFQSIPKGIKVWGFSVYATAPSSIENVHAQNVRHSPKGMDFEVIWRNERMAVSVPLFGDFNLENVLTVLTTLLARGESLQNAALAMRKIVPVAGRMECFHGAPNMPYVFVDYAHTPDALSKALQGLKQHCKKKLWVVFGCGGNRDQGKRAQMGCIAEQWADFVVVTNDNPRDETAADIINDVLAGCQSSDTIVIPDRAAAINKAIRGAQPEDMVLIAGKGHEEYQEINGVKTPFNDAEIVKKLLSTKNKQGDSCA